MTPTTPTAEGDAPAPRPFRLLPRLTDDNRFYWTSGADGVLRMLRCRDCGHWVHPPLPRCPVCLSGAVDPADLSGRGIVHTFTVNYQPWYPGLDPPYVVAIVELSEQKGLRLTTGVVGCDVDDVRVGLPVRVTFEQYDDVWLPFFTPDG